MSAGKRSNLFYLTAAVGIVAGLLFLVIGCPGPEDQLLKQFREEPTITLDKPTGGSEQIKLEKYVEGVVAGEMKPGWPQQAYEAQAILARSYALYILTADGTQPPEKGRISAEHRTAQAYNPSNIKPIITKAVAATRGRVIVYKGKFPQAYFHSASGGWTATAVNAGLVEPGKEPPYIKVVESPEDKVAPPEIKSWTATFSGPEVTKALAKVGANVAKLEGMDVGKKDPHGRALTLSVKHDGGKTTEVSAPKFRVALSPDKMRSALLTKIGVSGGSVTMSGRGFGHGAGLSQYGAYQLATEGRKADEIVSHYFEGVSFKQLWK